MAQLSFVSCCVFEETVHGFLPQTDVCKTLVKAVAEGLRCRQLSRGLLRSRMLLSES
jgi:hypothetical protein